MPSLTKRAVDAIRPAKTDVYLWDAGDGAIKGFGVRMKPSGIASFIVQYRNLEGRGRKMVLGRVGTVTPDQARALAADALRKVRAGADPSADRHAARNAMTVAELCDWYLAEAGAGRLLGKKRRPIKASTLAMDRSRIERHVKPLIGRRAVSGLTLADVEKMQADIAAGKTARPRLQKGRTGVATGGIGVASRTVGMMHTILQFAWRNKLIERNPADGVQRFADNKNTRYLSLEEIGRLGKAMREAEREGKSRVGMAAVRALLLTGCRKNEILALPWDWFDPKARCIHFGDAKSGAQTRALGLSAVQELVRQPQDSTWIFPATSGAGHFIGVSRVLDDLCARAKLEGVSPHVLRHTFGSIAAELDYSEITIAGLLGHASRGVTQRYSHVPDKALLAAADTVSSRIAAALDGTPEAKVLPMKRRRA